MAAAIATIGALRDEGAIEAMDRLGTALRAGILAAGGGARHRRQLHRAGRRCRT